MTNQMRGSGHYDDNFGHWDDMDDPDVAEYYHRVQAQSVETTCKGCRRRVRLMPQYAYCYACAATIERGGEIDY